MNSTTTTLAAGTPGVMMVISAADLKEVVTAMCKEHERNTAKAIEAHRELPTMSRHQAMKALNVTASTLWRWAKEGYLVPVKIGTKVLYRATDIDRLLHGNEKGGEA